MDRSRKAFDELTAQERRLDFKEKNDVLSKRYQQIPAILFYSDFLFHDMNEEEFRPSIILYKGKVVKTEEGDKSTWKRKAIYVDEIPDYFDRNDVAINPCGYWNNYPKARLMRRIYAFAMDVDEVRPDTMRYLIDLIESGQFPRPTAITNSGSGVHFFFILDVAMQVGYQEKYLQNLQFAQQIYYRLHSKLEDLYGGAQRHHIGQDYRVVGSVTKFGDTTTAWQSGKLWSVEDLAAALGLNVDEFYQPMTVASSAMQAYARSIARSLKIAVPDMTDSRGVYDFIAEHKDAAYKIRETERQRAGKKKKKLRGWYETTWNRVYTKTKAGNRFNAMKGLAIVAYKAGISEERFEHDLYKLSTLWQEQIWKGADPFNADNVEAILRMFRNGERYRKTRRETLEELFGWRWSGTSSRRKKPMKQSDHVKIMSTFRDIKYPNGEWRYKGGAPTAQAKVQNYRLAHPEATKAECHRATGLDPKTIRKWWG